MKDQEMKSEENTLEKISHGETLHKELEQFYETFKKSLPSASVSVVSSDENGIVDISVLLKDKSEESIQSLVDVMLAIHNKDFFSIATKNLYNYMQQNNQLDAFNRFVKIFTKEVSKLNKPLISPIALGLSYDGKRD